MSTNLSLFSSILYKLQVSNLKLFYCLVLSFVFSLSTNDIKNSIRKVKKTVFNYWPLVDNQKIYWSIISMCTTTHAQRGLEWRIFNNYYLSVLNNYLTKTILRGNSVLIMMLLQKRPCWLWYFRKLINTRDSSSWT